MKRNELTNAQRVAIWRRANPAKYKAQQQKSLAKRKANGTLAAFYRRRNLKGKYGLSVQDYEDMRAAQNSLCAICGNPQLEKLKFGLAVDHCHTTGRVRKLLCNPCNLTLEHIESSRAPLEKYLAYIKEHNEKVQ